MDLFKKESLLLIVLIVFSASVFLLGLGAMPLTDPDEVFYAETAREMLARGEILTPYIFGEPQFEKPPLYYWLVIASFKVFGINEFSARFPSAMFGILGVVAIYFLGKILVNKRTGFFASLVFATSVKYIALSKACVTDIVLTVSMLAAFLFFFYGYLSETGKRKWYLFSASCLGLAVLTKGPIGILLPGAIICIYLALTKELKRLKEIPFISGGLLFLAVALPWYLLMYKAHGTEFIDAFFGFHNIIRFLEPEHAIGDVFYYYVPIIAVGFLPWTIFLPLGIWQAVRDKETRTRRTNIFLGVWFFAIFVFFSLSRTKLPTYVFPLYPALALSVGRFLDVFFDGGLSKNMKKAMRFLPHALFILLAGGLTVLYFVAKIKYPTVVNMVSIAGAVFFMFMIFIAASLKRKKYAATLAIFMLFLIISVFLLSYFVFPELGRYESSKEISGILLTVAKPGEKIGAEDQYQRGVAFYTGREDIIDVHPHNTITKLLPRKERVWCVIKEKNHIQLYTNKEKSYEHPTYVVYKLGKKVIITNKIPPDGKFLKKRTINEPY